jgi:CheY-like chemotaxis protein
MYGLKKFEISVDHLVLLVDDSPIRIEKLINQLPASARVAVNSQDAIAWLRQPNNKPDWVFLDFDGATVGETFEPVARYLAASRYVGRVLIHSVNEDGGKLLKKILTIAGVTADICPFGLFRIKLVASRRR